MTTAAPEASATTTPVAKPETAPKEYHVDEMATGQRDEFTAAFNRAQDQLAGEEDKPKEKAKTKPKAEKEEKPAPKKEAKKAEPEKADDDGEEEAEEETKAEAKKPETPQKLEAKKWWNAKKRDAFAQMPRHIQEEWLAETPQAPKHWSEDQRAAFEKLQPEGQEILLERHQELERGANERFMSSAADRKFSEEIRAAVSPQMRNFMQQRGLTEQQVFSKLLGYQHQAMTDPVGYVRQFIANSKINPLDVIPMDSDGKVSGSPAPSQPADIKAHPDYQALAAEVQALRAERQQREAENHQKGMVEFQGMLAEKDGEGNSLYPFIRILADPMAQIIRSDPERYGSLSVKDRLTVAYHQALDDFPELSAIRLTAPKPKADEPAGDNAASADSERDAKLEKAIAPKSRTPQVTPASSGAVTLDEAIARAAKKVKR